MVCTECGTANEPTARFCVECGTAFGLTCPSCGAAVRPGQKFCAECGISLGSAAALRSPGLPPPRAGATSPVAERRVCSVLFADLVGFTTLAEARDPEEVRELLSRYFDTARTVIGRYGGVVEKFIGDAVMAVWGTPTAAEGDAERAVRAGLDLVDAVSQLGRELGTPGLAARAGVVTGPVAVTLGAQGQGMVAGDAVNTAARVQSAARPGTLLVDEGTWRVAREAVAFTEAGEHTLKGKDQRLRLWEAGRVLSGVGGSQRVDGLEAPFVGRDAELRLVKDLFHACVERRAPRLVSVVGAAGVGKSRLGWEFFKYIDGLADLVLWHRGRCLSYGDGVAFWALAEMVRQRLGIADEDPVDLASEKLRTGLARWLSDETERAYVEPRLAQLLGTDTAAGQSLGRDELFAGWRLFFERLAGDNPVVLLIEDLHHADAGLLDFCEHLLDWARDVPIFVLTLARPELESRRPGWGAGRRNSTALGLEPLSEPAMAELLEGLVPAMPAPAKSAIAQRAEGIPLYAVETVRMLIDRDVVQPIDGIYRLLGEVGELAVPATLQSLLAARLDALDPEVRRVVADAAVLGGSFPRDALIAVSGLASDDVERVLAELVRREVLGVRADPLSPQRGQYAFVQTMLRQVAYDTLSRRERKTRHLAVAAHLKEAFAGGGEEVAEVIAAHLVDALSAVPDDPDVPALRSAAVEMLTRAGERAQRTGAPQAATRSFAAAAELLDQTGNSSDELAAARLLERAGEVISQTDTQVAIDHYRRAGGIYRTHNCARDAARADVGVATSLGWTGQHEEARQLLLAALTVLEPDPDEDTVVALGALAGLETFAGDPDAGSRTEAALALGQALDLPESRLSGLLVIRAIGLYFNNRSLEGVAYLREALRIAEATQNSMEAGRVLLNLAEHLTTTDPPAAAEAARTAAAHCRRVGASLRLAFAVGNLMLALVATGDWDDAEEVYQTAVDQDGLGDNPVLSTVAVLLHALRGQNVTQEAELLVNEASQDPQEQAGTAMARAAAAMREGDHVAALDFARKAISHTKALGLRSEAIRWGWPLAADAALALGDEAEAQRLIEWLEAHPPGHVPPVLRAEKLRVRARLLSLHRDTAADAAFEETIRAMRELGSPYHLAVGLLEQAEHLAATGRLVHEQLLEEAVAIAGRLGAQPLLQRAERLSVRGTPATLG